MSRRPIKYCAIGGIPPGTPFSPGSLLMMPDPCGADRRAVKQSYPCSSRGQLKRAVAGAGLQVLFQHILLDPARRGKQKIVSGMRLDGAAHNNAIMAVVSCS